jgi:hypothetical protein
MKYKVRYGEALHMEVRRRRRHLQIAGGIAAEAQIHG